jgi:hypothetical protein
MREACGRHYRSTEREHKSKSDNNIWEKQWTWKVTVKEQIQSEYYS